MGFPLPNTHPTVGLTPLFLMLLLISYLSQQRTTSQYERRYLFRFLYLILFDIQYVIGSVFGNVSFAAVEFAGSVLTYQAISRKANIVSSRMSIPSQAFLDISSAENPALQYGANGVVGLGFTSLSTIDAQLNSTRSSAGRSLLYNLFQAHPSEPNFLAFALQRSTEEDDEVEGSFSIGSF